MQAALRRNGGGARSVAAAATTATAAAIAFSCVAGFATTVVAAERTTVVQDAATHPDGSALDVDNSQGNGNEPRYSQAVAMTMHLARETGGGAVAGSACTPSCSVILTIAPADDPGNPAATMLVSAQGIVVGDDGATQPARVSFVDGRYATQSGDPGVLIATTSGTDYVVTATFLGTGAGVVPENPDCQPDAAENQNGDLCPSTSTQTLTLFAETSNIELAQGNEADLGDTIVLAATVSDPNGDAPEGGTDIDGPAGVPLVGVDVQFVYDVNNDGNASADEIVGTSPTNAAGVASLELALDPNFIRAGTYESGLQCEFSGDDHFGVARASTRIVVHPAGVDVSRTIIEVTPESIPADGFAKSELRVRLVDTFNNPLDENSEEHDVELATTLGTLNDGVERDLLDGTYTQVLQAQRKGGTATITVTVDGVTGPTRDLEIVGGKGCTCAAADAPAFTLAALLALLLARRVRKPAR